MFCPVLALPSHVRLSIYIQSSCAFVYVCVFFNLFRFNSVSQAIDNIYIYDINDCFYCLYSNRLAHAINTIFYLISSFCSLCCCCRCFFLHATLSPAPVPFHSTKLRMLMLILLRALQSQLIHFS